MTKFCPFCGEELVDNAKFCKACGKNIEEFNSSPNYQPDYQDGAVENDHTAATVLGFVGGLLIPLIGIIVGIYLLTRDSPTAKRNGKYVIAFSLFIWFISFIIIFR